MNNEELTLTIDGTEYPITVTFEGVRAIGKLLGASKLNELDKMLGKVGYDNAHKVATSLLNTSGANVTEQQVDAAITDAGFPVQLVQRISNAIAGPDTAAVTEVQQAAIEGN